MSKDITGPEKLFFAELHPKDKEAERVFEVECRKKESTDQVAGQDTVIDISFYFICTLASQQGEAIKNSERYPLHDVCLEMSNFISNLSEKLSLCRTRLLTSHIWHKFFERKVAMTEVEVHDMLRFS